MKKFKNFIKEYFNFSTRERNGILVLIAVLLVGITVKIVLYFANSEKAVDFSLFETQIENFKNSEEIIEAEQFYFDPNTASENDFKRLGLSQKAIHSILNFREKGGKFKKIEDFQKIYNISEDEFNFVKDFIVIQNENKSFYNKNNYPKQKQEIKLYKFDPNTATKEDFLNFGLKEWLANNIINSRENGKIFRSADDFSKVYGLKKEQYEQLKDYIDISETFVNQTVTEKNFTSTKDKNIILDINSATAADFQKLQGIGPAFAERIIEYRKKLGGFVNIEQIKEVYNFTPEMFEDIKNQLDITTTNIKKININKADFKTLIAHPYIDQENANLILSFKKFAGKINSFDDLLKQKAIKKDFYEKIKPYITTE